METPSALELQRRETERLAQKIAHLRAVLRVARDMIHTDRVALADASMGPDGTMDPDDAAAVADYDRALGMIDDAIRGAA